MEEIIEELKNPYANVINRTVVVALPVRSIYREKMEQIVSNYKAYVEEAVKQQFPKAVFDEYDFFVTSVVGSPGYMTVGLSAKLKQEAKKRYEKAFAIYQKTLKEREEATKAEEHYVTVPLATIQKFILGNFPMIGNIDKENALRFFVGENYEFTPSPRASTKNR